MNPNNLPTPEEYKKRKKEELNAPRLDLELLSDVDLQHALSSKSVEGLKSNNFSSSPVKFDFKEYENYVDKRSVFMKDLPKLDKMRAEDQGIAEELYAGFKNFIPNIALNIVHDVGSLAAIATERGDDAKDFSNEITRWANRNMDPNGTIYLENPNEAFDMGDSAWWIKNSSDGLASVYAFMAEGWATGGALSLATKGALGATKLAAGAVIKAIPKTSGLSRSINAANKAAKLGQPSSSYKLLRASEEALKTYVPQVGSAFVLSSAESSRTAAEVYNTTYENAKLNKLTDEEAKLTASNAAVTTYELGTLMLMTTNIAPIRALLRSNKAIAAKFNPVLKRRKSVKTGKLESKSAWMKRLEDAGTSKEVRKIALQEGNLVPLPVAGQYIKEAAEEGVEEMLTELSGVYGKSQGEEAIKKKTNKYNEDLDNLDFMDAISTTLGSEEAWASGFWGAFMGGAMKGSRQGLSWHKSYSYDEDGKLEYVTDTETGEKKPAKKWTTTHRKHRDHAFREFARHKNALIDDLTYVKTLSADLAEAATKGTSSDGRSVEELKQELFDVTKYRSVVNGYGENIIEELRQISKLDNTKQLSEDYKEQIKELDKDMEEYRAKLNSGGEATQESNDILTSMEMRKRELMNVIEEVGSNTEAMQAGFADKMDTEEYTDTYKQEAEQAIKDMETAKVQYDHINSRYNSNTDKLYEFPEAVFETRMLSDRYNRVANNQDKKVRHLIAQGETDVYADLKRRANTGLLTDLKVKLSEVKSPKMKLLIEEKIEELEASKDLGLSGILSSLKTEENSKEIEALTEDVEDYLLIEANVDSFTLEERGEIINPGKKTVLKPLREKEKRFQDRLNKGESLTPLELKEYSKIKQKIAVVELANSRGSKLKDLKKNQRDRIARKAKALNGGVKVSGIFESLSSDVNLNKSGLSKESMEEAISKMQESEDNRIAAQYHDAVYDELTTAEGKKSFIKRAKSRKKSIDKITKDIDKVKKKEKNKARKEKWLNKLKKDNKDKKEKEGVKDNVEINNNNSTADTEIIKDEVEVVIKENDEVKTERTEGSVALSSEVKSLKLAIFNAAKQLSKLDSSTVDLKKVKELLEYSNRVLKEIEHSPQLFNITPEQYQEASAMIKSIQTKMFDSTYTFEYASKDSKSTTDAQLNGDLQEFSNAFGLNLVTFEEYRNRTEEEQKSVDLLANKPIKLQSERRGNNQEGDLGNSVNASFEDLMTSVAHIARLNGFVTNDVKVEHANVANKILEIYKAGNPWSSLIGKEDNALTDLNTVISHVNQYFNGKAKILGIDRTFDTFKYIKKGDRFELTNVDEDYVIGEGKKLNKNISENPEYRIESSSKKRVSSSTLAVTSNDTWDSNNQVQRENTLLGTSAESMNLFNGSEEFDLEYDMEYDGNVYLYDSNLVRTEVSWTKIRDKKIKEGDQGWLQNNYPIKVTYKGETVGFISSLENTNELSIAHESEVLEGNVEAQRQVIKGIRQSLFDSANSFEGKIKIKAYAKGKHEGTPNMDVSGKTEKIATTFEKFEPDEYEFGIIVDSKLQSGGEHNIKIAIEKLDTEVLEGLPLLLLKAPNGNFTEVYAQRPEISEMYEGETLKALHRLITTAFKTTTVTTERGNSKPLSLFKNLVRTVPLDQLELMSMTTSSNKNNFLISLETADNGLLEAIYFANDNLNYRVTSDGFYVHEGGEYVKSHEVKISNGRVLGIQGEQINRMLGNSLMSISKLGITDDKLSVVSGFKNKVYGLASNSYKKVLTENLSTGLIPKKIRTSLVTEGENVRTDNTGTYEMTYFNNSVLNLDFKEVKPKEVTEAKTVTKVEETTRTGVETYVDPLSAFDSFSTPKAYKSEGISTEAYNFPKTIISKKVC